jgi:hypothetical protein
MARLVTPAPVASRRAAAGSCVPGRGGELCAPCPSGTVSAGGKTAACTPCGAGNFTDAGQRRVAAHASPTPWQGPCHNPGCARSAAGSTAAGAFQFVGAAQAKWTSTSQAGIAVRMQGGDPQCLVDPASPPELPSCQSIASTAEMQKATSGATTALRTLTCGQDRASTYLGTFAKNSRQDPGGYDDGSWCRAVKQLLKNTGARFTFSLHCNAAGD